MDQPAGGSTDPVTESRLRAVMEKELAEEVARYDAATSQLELTPGPMVALRVTCPHEGSWPYRSDQPRARRETETEA